MEKMDKKKLRYICISGVFFALVFVFTAYVHVPVFSSNGYTHVGDAFVYLAACILPAPYAIFAGAGGAALADVLTGFAVWAPGTVIIKSAAVLCFSRKGGKIITVRNLSALVPAWAICIGGYYLYESLITLNFIAPAAGIPGYVIQSALSSALFVLSGKALEGLGVRRIIEG